MRLLRHLVGAGIVWGTVVAPAFAFGQSITALLTPGERARAGLSKLSPSEVAALDGALLRVFGELSTIMTPSAAVGRTRASTSDLNLFDSRGRAAVFLEPSDDLTFYLWSGEPVAYLDDDSVYGFNGKHLGWYRNGAVYDQDGDIVVAPASMFRGAVEAAPPRGIRGLKPLKGIKELRPLKPLFGLSWARMPAAVFFLRGID